MILYIKKIKIFMPNVGFSSFVFFCYSIRFENEISDRFTCTLVLHFKVFRTAGQILTWQNQFFRQRAFNLYFKFVCSSFITFISLIWKSYKMKQLAMTHCITKNRNKETGSKNIYTSLHLNYFWCFNHNFLCV